MDNLMMEPTCRVCLQGEELMINIYEIVEELNTDLSTLLEQCGGLKVEKNDFYPKYLCRECTNELLISARFREKCARTQDLLNQIEETIGEEIEEEKVNEVIKEEVNQPEVHVAQNVSKKPEQKPEPQEEQFKVPMMMPKQRKTQQRAAKPAPAPKPYVEEEAEEVEYILDANTLLPLGNESMLGIESGAEQTQETFDATHTFNEDGPGTTTEIIFELESIGNGSVNGSVYNESINNEPQNNYDYLENNLPSPSLNELVIYSDAADELIDNNQVTVYEELDSIAGDDIRKNEPALLGAYQFICDVCGALFMQAINLRRHMEKSHNPSKTYDCGTCGHCFSLEKKFTEHFNICEYNSDGPVKGKQRNKPINSTYAARKFQRQSQNNTGYGDRSRNCPFCNHHFTSQFALSMHVRSHTNERPFGCEFCEKSFKTQSALSTHLNRHAGLPNYSCTVCDKRFYESSNLNAHMRSHTGEKPHVCTVCGTGFSRVFLLTTHMRKHTGEKPYECTVCKRAFAQQCDLKSHMKTLHSSERRYQCPVCPKAFTKRYPMRQHLEKHQMMGVSIDIETVLAMNRNEEYLTDEYNTGDASADMDYNNGTDATAFDAMEHDFDLNDYIIEEV